MNDFGRLGRALCEATRAAEEQGWLPQALVALTPIVFVALGFAGRELLLLALDQEIKKCPGVVMAGRAANAARVGLAAKELLRGRGARAVAEAVFELLAQHLKPQILTHVRRHLPLRRIMRKNVHPWDVPGSKTCADDVA